MNWEQMKAIVWLRWRLSKNRFARGGSLNAALSVVVMALLLIGGVAAGAVGFLAGAFGVAGLEPEILLLVWDGMLLGFLLFWLGGLMAEIQRSESIDLAKLFHLPVTLQQVFVFNYVASHLTPAIIFFLPGMMGLCLGLTIGVGFRMALLIPLVLGSVFMITAWTYCLRGWLAALMVNKRRRRAIMVWVTLGFVLLSQLPNLLINTHLFGKFGFSPVGLRAGGTRRNGQGLELPERVLQAHVLVPIGWVGYGAMHLRQSNPWPAVGGTVGGFLIGALGIFRAYRMTIRFYQSAEGKSRVRKQANKAVRRTQGELLVARRLPWVSDDTAALALATLRSLLRAPELKMAFIMPLVMIVALCSIQFTRPKGAPPEALAAFAATAAAALAAFSFLQLMSNAFGLDRNGFRALVLLPTRRQHILLAKNLAFFPFIGAVGLILLLLAKFFVHMAWQGFLAGVIQIPLTFLLFSLLFNLTSIYAPYRLGAGTLQAKKPKAIVFLASFVSMLVTPFVLAPAFIPPLLQLLLSYVGGLAWLPVNLLASLAMLALVGWLYRIVLPIQGRLLQRREQYILQEVTEEAE